ncbi:MAG: DNA (cytosine-5-)-methyltransferase [Bacteroidales bacterium]|nr:DNA (cytosine-5-)-methyltransferase [Bacteroidales bacterium]
MQNSKKYPYLNVIDSQALFDECEKNGTKDSLSILTQFLHNSKYASKETKKTALDFISDSIFKDKKEESVLRDDPLELYFKEFFDVPFPEPEKPKFTFIDLFAGMGGFRLAMQSQGGKCIFSSEWNQYAQKTYMANFGDMPFGDITKEETKSYIPEHFDVLCAGFPCQPFSIAGVSKKNSLGRETGFKDKTQGTLFFDVADIISRHRPKAFYLENVKNLVSHDRGRTFKVITETLDELDYSIHYEVLDGKSFVPQHRERIMIVGYDRRIYGGKEKFEFPKLGEPVNCIGDILEQNVPAKYTLSDKLWGYLQNYAQKHKEKGNGFGYGLVDLNGITRTLSARYYKDGSEILIPQGDGVNPRRLTPRECARLMGYPDEYIINAVSEVQAYRQCGNSVIVPLITAVAEQLVKTMKKKV